MLQIILIHCGAALGGAASRTQTGHGCVSRVSQLAQIPSQAMLQEDSLNTTTHQSTGVLCAHLAPQPARYLTTSLATDSGTRSAGGSSTLQDALKRHHETQR